MLLPCENLTFFSANTVWLANVRKALGLVSTIVKSGDSVAFDASGSYIEDNMTKNILWFHLKSVKVCCLPKSISRECFEVSARAGVRAGDA